MATKDTNRVSKDTSARKHSSVHSDAQAKATKQYYDALMEGLTEGYDQKIEELEVDHDKQIAALKAQLAETHETDLEKQKQVVEGFTLTNTKLQQEVGKLTTKYKQLQTTLDEELAKHKTEMKSTLSSVRVAQSQVITLKASHATELANLQKQLAVGPNSWVEVHFKGKGFKDRTYVLRPTTIFSKAVEELCTSSRKAIDELQWEHNGRRITIHIHSRSLQQLGIKDGDQVFFSKS